eukprot:12017413-Alexandrium_andersonii.AAC.1
MASRSAFGRRRRRRRPGRSARRSSRNAGAQRTGRAPLALTSCLRPHSSGIPSRVVVPAGP